MATLTAGRGFNSRSYNTNSQRIGQYSAWAAVLLFILLAGSWIHLWASETRFSGLCQAIEGQSVDGDTKKLKVFAASLKDEYCF
jgi:hypothetical protein